MSERSIRPVKLDDEERYLNQSLTRGLLVLDSFDADHPTLSLAEIAGRVGLSQSTTFRFAATLTKLGYLTQDSQSRRYQLGIKVLGLGNTFLASARFPEIALPLLEQLSQQCSEAANMCVLDGREVVYVARVAAKRIIALNLHVGSRLPAHGTSMGKAILAYRPWDYVAGLYPDGKLDAYTGKTITALTDLARDLEKVRDNGYALNDEELEIGLRSVAAPVRNASGEVVAAVNVSSSTARVPLDTLLVDFAPMVQQTADEISAMLGYGLASRRLVVRGMSTEYIVRPARISAVLGDA